MIEDTPEEGEDVNEDPEHLPISDGEGSEMSVVYKASSTPVATGELFQVANRDTLYNNISCDGYFCVILYSTISQNKKQSQIPNNYLWQIFFVF